MTSPLATMRARAALWLVVALAVFALLALDLVRGLPLQTNLLALLPPTERNPVAEIAVGRLADAAGNRAVFLVGDRPPDAAAAAARALAGELRGSGAFRLVVADIPALGAEDLVGVYRPYRFNLLSEADRAALDAGGAAELRARLERKLYAPFRFGLTLPVADDPLGLTDNWIATLPLKSWKLESENGLLVARGFDKHWVLVSAGLTGSAYDSAVQRASVAAANAAIGALGRAHAGAEVLRTGTVFYAEAARSSAEREVDLIGAGSLAGIVLLLYFVFRSLRPLALGVVAVGFGVAAAIVVTIAVHGELHLLALVFGASLIGEAIDYAIQYFAAHLGAGAAWDPLAGLARIAPGLRVALATSLLGYGALLLSPFPALAQIALFALVGLSASWISVFLLLPLFLQAPTTREAGAAVGWAQALLRGWNAKASVRGCALGVAALLLAAAPGLVQLTGNDDVHLLIARPPALVADEEKIRALTGFAGGSQFFLVEGETPDAVLAGEEKLAAALAPLVAAGEISGFQSLSSFVPSASRQAANRAAWRDYVFADDAALRRLFAEAGLRDELAPRLAGEFAAAAERQLTLEAWLKTPLAAPFRHLWLGRTEAGYATIVQPQGVRAVAPLAHAAQVAADAGARVDFVDKAGSVSRLFAAYRQGGALWLGAALVLVYGVLALRYRLRLAALMLVPTLVAMAVALAVFGYAREPLTMFNLMGLMLVLGVGVNYSIFLREGGARAAASLTGVLLSAATTLLSFGLLAFSSMPALAGFGLTLLLGIGSAVVLAPLVLTLGGERE